MGIVIPRQPLPRQNLMSADTASNNRAAFSPRLAEAERKRKADLAAADQAAAQQRAAAAAEQQRLAEERKVPSCWAVVKASNRGIAQHGVQHGGNLV